MNAEQEIARLDQQLTQLMDEFPNTYATLRITNTSFRAATKDRWEARNWSVKDEEVHAFIHGDAEERRGAFLSLLKFQYISKIEFVPGIDIVEVVPDLETADAM